MDFDGIVLARTLDGRAGPPWPDDRRHSSRNHHILRFISVWKAQNLPTGHQRRTAGTVEDAWVERDHPAWGRIVDRTLLRGSRSISTMKMHNMIKYNIVI